jgi:hypothetical protein
MPTKYPLLLLLIFFTGCPKESEPPKIGDWYESKQTGKKYKIESIATGDVFIKMAEPYRQLYDSVYKLYDYWQDSTLYYDSMANKFYEINKRTGEQLDSSTARNEKTLAEIEAVLKKIHQNDAQIKFYRRKKANTESKARKYQSECEKIAESDKYVVKDEIINLETYIKFENIKPILMSALEKDYVKVK